MRTPITSIGSIEHNENVSTMMSLQVDNLLNPLAILLCYYSSVIFLRDILSHEKNKSNNVPLQPMNSNNFQYDIFYFILSHPKNEIEIHNDLIYRRQYWRSIRRCQDICETILPLHLPTQWHRFKSHDDGMRMSDPIVYHFFTLTIYF